MKQNIVRIVRGQPGAGKSTFARKMWPGVLLLENDMFHMHSNEYEFSGKRQDQAINWCIDLANLTVSKGADVVIANTFTKSGYIECYERLAKLFGAGFEVYRMMGKWKNVHGLTDAMVENFTKSIQDWPGEKLVYPDESCELGYKIV